MTQVVTNHPPPSAAEPTDEELLLRYRDLGVVEAFEAIVRRYEQPIYYHPIRIPEFHLPPRDLVDCTGGVDPNLTPGRIMACSMETIESWLAWR